MDLGLEPIDLSREDFSKPLAVTPKRACELLSIGMTRFYELLGSGELDSFHIGRARRITTASIRSYIARQLVPKD